MSQFKIPEVKPESILLIGDIHGFVKTYQKFLERLPEGQRTIQLGDMACGFPGVGIPQMSDNHKWIRGNHDDPEKSRSHPNYLGDYGYLERDGIFYIGGASSIDKAYRTEGRDWWPGEELSYAELDKAVGLYKEIKPRIVISHECPSKTSGVLLAQLLGPYFAAKGECSQSRTAQALQIMLETHQPEQWYFGHYHLDKEFYTPGFDTKFRIIGAMMESGEPPHYYELEAR